MAQIFIIYDEDNRVTFNPEDIKHTKAKMAQLPIAEGNNIIDVSRRLMDLFIEQIHGR